MLKRERSLVISNTVFLISTSKSKPYWVITLGSARRQNIGEKTDAPWRCWKQGEYSDSDQASTVHPGVTDLQYKQPEQAQVCASLPSACVVGLNFLAAG